MSIPNYYLLAYDVDVENPSTLYAYMIPEERVGFARYLLNRDQVPHAISKEPGITGVKIYATDRSNLLENELSCKYLSEKIQPSEITLSKLISSAIRLRFLECGWVSSASKIYKPDTNRAEPLINNLALRYEHAIRLTVDNLGSGRKAVFMDPTSKIEFTATLDHISKTYPKQSEEISFVKIRGTSTSFYIINDERVRGSYEELYSKIADVISYYQGVNISLPKNTQKVITVIPKSLKLSNILRDKIPSLPLSGKHVILPLPAEAITPVGSLDNISLFGSTPFLVIPPEKRARIVREIVSELGLGQLDFRGMRLKIRCDELLSVPPENLMEIVYSSKRLKELWDWKPAFSPSNRRLLLLVKLRSDEEAYNERVLQSIYRIRKELNKWLPNTFNVLYTEVSASLEDLDLAIRSYSRGYDEKYVILLYNKNLDENGNLVGRFELELARRGFYPHAIDLSSNDVNYDNKITFKLMSIMKDFATRANAVPSAPTPPPQLKGVNVVGIDSTIVPLGRSHVYVGVAIVLVRSDGSVSYDVRISHLAGSDMDVLTSAIQEELRGSSRLLIIVNKSSLSMFLESLGSEVFKDCVLVGVTKTHSYSRILASYGNRFVNPSKVSLFVELAPLYAGEVQISRYLAITTMYSKEGYEAGTIRPVLFNIAGNVEHKAVLQYLQELTYYAPISKLWLPSVPWPMSKADKMCKKLSRILRASGGTSIPVDIPQEVWRKL